MGHPVYPSALETDGAEPLTWLPASVSPTQARAAPPGEEAGGGGDTLEPGDGPCLGEASPAHAGVKPRRPHGLVGSPLLELSGKEGCNAQPLPQKRVHQGGKSPFTPALLGQKPPEAQSQEGLFLLGVGPHRQARWGGVPGGLSIINLAAEEQDPAHHVPFPLPHACTWARQGPGGPRGESSQGGTVAQSCPRGCCQTGGGRRSTPTRCRAAWDEQLAFLSPTPALHLKEGSQVGVIRDAGPVRARTTSARGPGGCLRSRGAGPAPFHCSGGVSSPGQPFTPIPTTTPQAACQQDPCSSARCKTPRGAQHSTQPPPLSTPISITSDFLRRPPQRGPQRARIPSRSCTAPGGRATGCRRSMAHTALGPPCHPTAPGDSHPTGRLQPSQTPWVMVQSQQRSRARIPGRELTSAGKKPSATHSPAGCPASHFGCSPAPLLGVTANLGEQDLVPAEVLKQEGSCKTCASSTR